MRNLKPLLLILFLFSFFFLSAEDYFWVGGQGTWSNLNSWRTSNGQIPAEVPDETDNVIFNNNSFLAPYDTVFILTGNPVCHNMTWQDIQDTVVIWGGNGASDFSVYGSITFSENVLNFYYGKITMVSSETGNTVTCNHTKFSGDLNFDGSGSWILQDTLFAYDSLDWKGIIYGGTEPLEPNPQIFLKQGTLDANEQTIITRGLHVIGTQDRNFDFSNSDCLMLGDWDITAENLVFDGTNSYIMCGGNMTNSFGTEITYNDIDFTLVQCNIKNTKIRSIHRKIHFLGGGKVEGATDPGNEGHFTIDTLLMEGAWTMAGPIPCEISGKEFNIHYTEMNQTMGYVDCDAGNFHRMDYNGVVPSYFKGVADIIDSIHFFVPEGKISSDVVINNLLYFFQNGVIGSGWGIENQINRAVFMADGWILGNNHIDSLSLSAGHWYQMSADSLTHPGSIHNMNRIQTVGYIEAMGDCKSGMVILSSDFKEIYGILNYTGDTYPTENIQVKDMYNIGNPLHIENGIKTGIVNDKFVFVNQRQPREMYWVGGTGVWSDTIHWSLDPLATLGDQCMPTLLDNVYFTATSGLDLDDTVFVDVPHSWCHDMTWYPDIPDTATFYGGSTFHVWGSLQLDESMTYNLYGDVYFESEDDTEYESVYWYNSTAQGRAENALGKVYFYGRNGKWELQSNFSNYFDTTFLKMGDLKLDNDTINVTKFIAMDTLPKKLSLLNHSLVRLHAYQSDAWVFMSYRYNQNTFFDAGLSTIQSLGDIMPPPNNPPGYCHIRSMGDSLIYHNIMFGDSAMDPGGLIGIKSQLKSENEVAIYNLVDYYVQNGVVNGHGVIDTLTFRDYTNSKGAVIEATGCNLKAHYNVNFLYAESDGDTVIQSHQIDTAYFYKPGKISGFNFIDYLQANQYLEYEGINQTQRAVFLGNAAFYQRNTFDTMQVSPNRRYTFQQQVGELDTTIITHDLNAIGNCDAPIRFESAIVGTPANVLYTALAPSNPGLLIDYGALLDINMIPSATTFTATNSVDLGGNSDNIDFSSNDIDTYYWVNGNGSWSDWYHWSDVSGGAPLVNQCTPREITNVVFDDNSFIGNTDTVLIDIPNAYCNNMHWIFTQADLKPVFLGADTTTLFVYGTMKLHDSMDYQYSGEVRFNNIDKPGNLPDTLFPHNQVFLNDIIFQGINDEVLLVGDLTLFVDQTNKIFNSIILENGTFRSQGCEIFTGGLLSPYTSSRTLDIQNSLVNLTRDEARSLWINGTNLELQAAYSTLHDFSNTSSIYNEMGSDLYYHNLIMEGLGDSLSNQYNTVHFNVIEINGDLTLVKGNYTADSVLLAGKQSLMDEHSIINFLHVTGKGNTLYGDNQITSCWFYNDGIIRNGNQFGKLMADGNVRFRGGNSMDSLYLFPGSSDNNGNGNKYYFENGEEQVVHDYIWIRGNRCSSLTIQNSPGTLNDFATIRLTDGVEDVACDYLEILNVNVVSDQGWDFYAGINSSLGRDPLNLPTTWIADNQQNYIFGFDGQTERFCLGEPFVLNAESFNGDPFTQYFWNGSPYPGGSSITVSEPGTYQIRVKYSDNCDVFDEITLVGDDPPIAAIDPGPFCAGDEIGVSVSPDYLNYQYQWSTGQNTPSITADLSYSGGISVQVLDPTNNCKANPNQTILVKPSPDPEAALGDDVTLGNGESVTLDAGWGNSWLWTSDPPTTITPNDQQFITVPGNPDTVTYFVDVTINGCENTGSIKVNEWPPSKLGVPTAFSPNGDDVNDKLYVLGSGFAELTFRVYDRYGKLVFETNDQSKGWDGTVNGLKQEMDVYTYYVRVVYLDEGVQEETGNITLLR